MPLFALPLDPSSIRPSSRSHLYPRTSTKRKRNTYTDQEDFDSVTSADELKLPAPGTDTHSAASHAASTNPLSLSKDDIEQYLAAGLTFDQELPSRNVPGFPHRGLPQRGLFWGNEDGDERDVRSEGDESDKIMTETENERERRVSKLRTRHLGVLTGILHRCLLEGDIARAKRAWAMLLRAEVNGKGIEIRNSGYWGIGAELLIRGETTNTDVDASNARQAETSNEVPMNEAEDSFLPHTQTEHQNINSTWGTPTGFAKAKEYYERLILQYPYKRQFRTSINALTFWPALLGNSIYCIQNSHQTTLEHLSSLQKQQLSASSESTSPSDQDAEDVGSIQDEGDFFHRAQRRSVRRRARIREQMWIARDEARKTALLAAETLAKDMDGLMTRPPFLDDATLLRLRGMVALFVGDLNVPALPGRRRGLGGQHDEEDDDDNGKSGNDDDDDDVDDEFNDDDDDDDEEADNEEREHLRGFFTPAEVKERRFLARQRRIEHARGRGRRKNEMERARRAFEAAKRAGADVEREIGMLRVEMEDEDEDEDEDEGEDEGDEN